MINYHSLNIRKVLPDFAIVFLRKIKRRIIKYPEFHYVELHLTDHCNLNCKGCGHFCPIADEWYADKEDYEKELIQLKKLFSNIKNIRLMGGEPLLHPDVGSFISLTRDYFPRADIRLVSNGILLKKMPYEFWEVCVEKDIKFDLTVYPPFLNQSFEWISLISGHNLKVLHYVADSFFTSLNFNGNSIKEKSFEHCQFHCPFLYKGKLYPCALPALSHYLNNEFKTNIPNNGFINIFEKGITGWNILDHLKGPIDACKFCSEKYRYFKWGVSQCDISEWDSRSPS